MENLTPIAKKILSVYNDGAFASPFDDILFTAIVKDDSRYDYLNGITSFEDTRKIVESAVVHIAEKASTMPYFFADSMELVLNEVDESLVSSILWDCIQKLK